MRVIYLKTYRYAQSVCLLLYQPDVPKVTIEFNGHAPLESLGLPAGSQARMVVVGPEPTPFPTADAVVNCVADADVYATELEQLNTILRGLQTKNPHLRVLNWPSNVLKTRRDTIATVARSLPGLVVPRTLRFTPQHREDAEAQLAQSGLTYPLLLRLAGKHSGNELLWMDSPAEVAALDAFPLNGATTLYATEFVDFAHADGFYRKLRIVMINGVPHLRHQIVGRHWNIHMRTRAEFMVNNPALKADESAFLARGMANFAPQVQQGLAQLHANLGLDVYGIDGACTPDGQLLLFEANPAMELIKQDITHYPYLAPHIQAIQKAWHHHLTQVASALPS